MHSLKKGFSPLSQLITCMTSHMANFETETVKVTTISGGSTCFPRLVGALFHFNLPTLIYPSACVHSLRWLEACMNMDVHVSFPRWQQATHFSHFQKWQTPPPWPVLQEPLMASSLSVLCAEIAVWLRLSRDCSCRPAQAQWSRRERVRETQRRRESEQGQGGGEGEGSGLSSIERIKACRISNEVFARNLRVTQSFRESAAVQV